MSSESYNSRFGGARRLYGQPVTNRLEQAHICIIGIGGVGSWCAEALVRSGVGEITLIDLGRYLCHQHQSPDSCAG